MSKERGWKPVTLSAACCQNPGDLEQTLGFSYRIVFVSAILDGDTELRQIAESSSSCPSAKPVFINSRAPGARATM